MPWNTQVPDSLQDLYPVIVVTKATINESAMSQRVMESIEVIFIFEHRGDPFTLPYVEGSVSNHPSVAAGTGSTKGMVMVHEEGAWTALEDEPRLVGRKRHV